VCRTLSEMVIIKSPRFGSYWNFFQKKNLHIASVNFASFVCPKVTNQPSGAFSRNFVLHSFTKFCWNMPPGFVKTGKYIGRLTHVYASISDSYVDKYLSQRKIYPAKVDSEITKQDRGKHWKFYVIYLLLRDNHFEFPFRDAELTEVLNKLERNLFELISQPQISLFFLENLMHLRFTKFQSLISFICISPCEHLQLFVQIPENFQNDRTHLLTSEFCSLLFQWSLI
jgi:hypothetical protein